MVATGKAAKRLRESRYKKNNRKLVFSLVKLYILTHTNKSTRFSYWNIKEN